jgi:hypothetical protein
MLDETQTIQARAAIVMRDGLFLAILCIVAGFTGLPLRAQISPGPLAKAHQPLDGPTNCTKCHDLKRNASLLKCLECHTEIRDRVVNKKGLHATFVGTNPAGQECAKCHSDHNGVNFALVRWDPNRESLDHSKTGYTLEGKHVGVACEKCHKAENIPAAARPGILVKDLNRTYLGLPRDCIGCHTDEHRGQVGTDCKSCHTLDGWKPASRFNHANSKYPLTGAHEKVDCAKCHASIQDANAKSYVKYTGLSFAKCTGCHADPHKGAFINPCESCHVTSSWTRVTQMPGFDHSKTKFPLLGKHMTVACKDCHTKDDFKTPVPHAKCMDCHQDAHHGQFNARADHGECASCHNEKDWKPSTFGVKEHAATKYPLEGVHVPVACDKCHVPKGLKGKDTEFKITATQCKDCHEDIHKGQFAAAPTLNRCETCHNLKIKGFRPAVYSLAKHKQTRFPLTGGHIAVPCADCHKAVPKGSVTPVKYRFDDRTCPVCHEDPHRGEFRAQMEARMPNGSTAGCEACHSTVKWNELTRFDHAATKFPLTGAHRGVACVDCHRPPALQVTMKNVDFTAAPKLCSGCHEDVHANQFAPRPEATDCSSCHDATRWKPAQFDHDTRTKYPLEGAHRDVPCLDCHKLTRQVAGKTVVFYNPTPTACKDCHGSNEVAPLR